MRKKVEELIRRELGGRPYSPSETARLILGIENEGLQLFAILSYLTGGRCSEILPYHPRKLLSLVRRDEKGKGIRDETTGKYLFYKKNNPDYPKQLAESYGIRKKDIRFEDDLIVITIRNEKNKRTHFKTAVLPIKKEQALVTRLQELIANKQDDEQLVTTSRQSMLYMLKRHCPKLFSLHFLRALRYMTLKKLYKLSSPLARKYMGWTDDRPAISYEMFVVDDLKDWMRGK